jgi:hypothetical protein
MSSRVRLDRPSLDTPDWLRCQRASILTSYRGVGTLRGMLAWMNIGSG